VGIAYVHLNDTARQGGHGAECYGAFRRVLVRCGYGKAVKVSPGEAWRGKVCCGDTRYVTAVMEWHDSVWCDLVWFGSVRQG
jgi:uncharacterized protein YfaT (DUF1175 family)